MKTSRYLKVIFILALLVFSFSLVAVAAVDETPPAAVDQTDGQYVPLNSVIQVKFDKSVVLNSGANITLTNKTGGASDPVEVKSIKTIEDTLYITPKYFLGFGQDFQVDVAADSVLNAAYKAAGNAAPISFTFQTDYHNFETAMTTPADPNSIENLIASGLTSRQIKIAAPKKYITSLNIVHKKAGSITGSVYETFGAITAIDIRTDKEVDHVTVKIGAGVATNAALEATGSTKLFTKTYTGLANSFDVTVTSYNKYNMQLDTQIVNVASTTDPVVSVKKTYTAYTAGKVFSLYDLLAQPTTFTRLLNENPMDKLMIQVAE